ncbi:MAG: hypothetical protein KA264_01820 [Crocinitomicaceae bacterium]|jgi:hypothetical protein|nr:hypothetical protein [Crocinitomicaceae bacterium]
MKNIFKNIKIEKIEFQSNINEVSVICEITKNDNKLIKSELIINFSDLNKLIGKIQELSGNLDIISFFKKTQLDYDNEIYSFEAKNTNMDKLIIEDIHDIYPIREIRA